MNGFNENGTQIEFDLYPKITNGLYAYLNIGFANTFLFRFKIRCGIVQIITT
jgi:YaiO family outer membrane protein